MSAKEFIELLFEQNKDSANPVESSFLCQAAIEAICNNRIQGDHGSRQSCLQEARLLQRAHSLQGKNLDPEVPRIDEELSALDLSQPDKVYDELEVLAKGLRKDIFGSDEVPFPQWDKAVLWIQTESSEIEEAPRDSEEGKALLMRLSELKQDLEVFYDRAVYLKITVPRLEYPAEDGGHLELKRAIAPNSHRAFGQLATFQRIASERTGLQPAVILVFVLSGIRAPLTHNFRTSMQIIGTKIAKTTLEFASPQPAWREVQQAYRFLRQMRGNRKGLRMSTEMIVAEIKKAGGMPRRGKMKFLEEIAERITEQTGEKLSRDGVRMRLRRLSDVFRQELGL